MLDTKIIHLFFFSLLNKSVNLLEPVETLQLYSNCLETDHIQSFPYQHSLLSLSASLIAYTLILITGAQNRVSAS